MDQLLLQPDGFLIVDEPWVAGFDPYTDYRHWLIWDGQVVAGFQRLSLITPPPKRFGWSSATINPSRLLILEYGLTYDRKLLRWATCWRMAAPWLKFALFWLRPRPDLLTACFREENFGCVRVSACRPVDLKLEKIQSDGGFSLNRLVLKSRRIIQEVR
ncbi:MAG: hypothetical protein MUE67_00060 [Anaerolineales bacterium]|nr:hypothetical protein [Anaerolineales bacterium]